MIIIYFKKESDEMNVMFTCFKFIFILCGFYGIYNLFKKNFELAVGNIIIPSFLFFFYFISAFRLPGTSEIEMNEISYFIQQFQCGNPFAIFTIIFLIMFVILLICNIRTIIKNMKKGN